MSLIETIKRICVDTVESTKPVVIVFGTVLSVNPTKIKLDQRLILNEAQLIFNGVDQVTLNVGDQVTMLRVQGGKKYCILPSEIISGGGGEFAIEYDETNENLILGV